MRLLYVVTALCLLAAAVSAQWEPDYRLTVNSSYSYTPYNNARCLAGLPGGVLHLVWYDGRNGGAEIFYKRSTDNGSTWTADQRLTFDALQSDYPAIAVADPYLHVVWFDNRDGNWEVYYKRSTDGGATWGVDTRLTTDPGNQWFPSVGAFGANVYVVWDDDRFGNGEVYLRRSTDSGASWEGEVRLTNESNASIYPSVTAVDSLVHVIWEDTRTYFDIWYKRSTDCGATWSDDIRLTTDAGASSFPSSWVEGADLYAVFDDNRAGNGEIFFKHSSDNGLSWSDDMRLTEAAGNSMSGSVVSSGNNVHVVWQDNRDGNYETYYKMSEDKGLSWKVDTRLTDDTARSLLPCVAASGSAVHAVWEDTRDGNLEIYYKRNPTGNTAIAELPLAQDVRPVVPTIARGVLNRGDVPRPAVLLDAAGRKVMSLKAGANDVSALAPGVYFLRPAGSYGPVPGERRVARLILAR